MIEAAREFCESAYEQRPAAARDGVTGSTIHRDRSCRVPGQVVSRRTWLWLCRRGRHRAAGGRFRPAPSLAASFGGVHRCWPTRPTLAPGADVLDRCCGDTRSVARQRLSPCSVRRKRGPTTITRRSATTAATPATTSSTEISSRRPTCRSSGARMRSPRRHAARPVHQCHDRIPSWGARPALRCRSTTSCRCRWPGISVRAAGPTTRGCGSPTTRPTCSPSTAPRIRTKATKGPSLWMPPNHAFWCQYSVQFADVLRGYALPIDQASADMLRQAAGSCPAGCHRSRDAIQVPV